MFAAGFYFRAANITEDLDVKLLFCLYGICTAVIVFLW